jgi:tRNA(adenine34) deaminase
MEDPRHALDRRMMQRCVELALSAPEVGEYPYAAVIAQGDRIVAEATNRVVRDGDLSRHAEIVAILEAGRAIGRERLGGATLYSLVEPCAMCAYCIREAGIGRVAYALGSPVMGGVTHWNILGDASIDDRIPLIFGPVPEIVTGLLAGEARQVWRDWSPVAWEMVELRGLLIEPESVETRPARKPSRWHFLRAILGEPRPPRTRPKKPRGDP